MAQSRSARRVADAEPPDLAVFGGDLTWGPLPEEAVRLVETLSTPALFVRGNAERALLEPDDEPTERAIWLRERHAPAALAFLARPPTTTSGRPSAAIGRAATRSPSR